MRLLFINQRFGAFGGAETYIAACAEYLQAHGHLLGCAFGEDTGKARAEWLSLFSDRYFLAPGTEANAMQLALEDFQPDLCYVHNLEAPPALQAIADSAVPFVRLVHDHTPCCLRRYKYNVFTRKVCTRALSPYCIFPCMGVLGRNRAGLFPVKFVSYRQKQLELALTRRAAALLVYSEFMRDELIQNGCDPIKIIKHSPLPAADEDLPCSSFGKRNLVLFAGQLVRGKGVDLLLKALAQVQEPFECVILGDGSHRAECERLSRRLGLEDRVTFAGFVPHAAAVELYTQASVFAVSSVWPEPFGLSGPEAMAYGLPVVAFDAGGIREWLMDGENGFLVPWMDTTAYASKIDFLLKEEAQARAMGQRGRKRVAETYSPAVHLQNLENLFSRLTSGESTISNETTALNIVHGNRH